MNPDQQQQFELWWEAEGQFHRAGGGQYEKTFAYHAWEAALAQRQHVPTTAWLVEWRFNGVQWLYLWPSAPGGFSFTSNASKALRFARREDAEAALQWARDTDAVRRPIGSLTRHGLALGEMLVTEHDWPALTAAPSAQAAEQPFAHVTLNKQGDIIRAMRRPDRWMKTDKNTVPVYVSPQQGLQCTGEITREGGMVSVKFNDLHTYGVDLPVGTKLWVVSQKKNPRD